MNFQSCEKYSKSSQTSTWCACLPFGEGSLNVINHRRVLVGLVALNVGNWYDR